MIKSAIAAKISHCNRRSCRSGSRRRLQVGAPATTPPPAASAPRWRRGTRRCAARARGGSGGSGPAPAKPRRRRARRWCGPRSPWSPRAAGRSPPACAMPAAIRVIIRHSQPLPSRQGVHWPQELVHVELRQPRDRLHDVRRLVHDDDGGRAEAATGPRAARRSPSGRCRRSTSGSAAPRRRRGSPPSRLSQPPRTPPQCLSMSSRKRDAHHLLDVARAGSRGPRCSRSWCRCCSGRPKPANQAAPRRRIVGATAIVSTLLTVVGRP